MVYEKDQQGEMIQVIKSCQVWKAISFLTMSQ